MKNTFLLWALILGGLLISAVPVWSAETLTGTVVYVDGDVTANGRVAETGDVLTGTVILQTGRRSEIEVVFAGRNIFRLGADTVVKVNFSELKKTVTLEKGVFTAVLKKLAQATGSASFLLKTPTANAGVRGTSFHVSTDGQRTYFCTCNGSVDLEAPGGPSLTSTNAHHGARVFTRTDGSVKEEPAELEGHTDASIETLAQRIGVSIDWTQPDLSHR